VTEAITIQGRLQEWARTPLVQARGKSGLHRAVSQVTPGRGNPTESATENRPPMASSWQHMGAQVRVKRRGKSPPLDWQQDRHGKPLTEQDQIGWRTPSLGQRIGPIEPAGRLLEVSSDADPRGMASSSFGSRQNPAYRPTTAPARGLLVRLKP
jgi:hypothetical protein